jgi:regulator of protease activity HflC (stomatin/prohibitin superfamily)
VQALIDFIIRNLMALWPIARVDAWENGVIVRNGRIIRTLKPGIHWRWWFIEQVKTAWSTELTIDLPNASIMTTDGESIIVSANIAYIIESIEKLWTTLSNSTDTIKNVSLGFLASECAKRSWTELTQDRDALQSEFTKHLQEITSPWGLKMTRVYITDLVPVRQYRLFGEALSK